jgi:hypothetical protein
MLFPETLPRASKTLHGRFLAALQTTHFSNEKIDRPATMLAYGEENWIELAKSNNLDRVPTRTG